VKEKQAPLMVPIDLINIFFSLLKSMGLINCLVADILQISSSVFSRRKKFIQV